MESLFDDDDDEFLIAAANQLEEQLANSALKSNKPPEASAPCSLQHASRPSHVQSCIPTSWIQPHGSGPAAGSASSGGTRLKLEFPLNPQVRRYQRDIILSAVQKNTLVSLPTGLGKTLIAAVLMHNYMTWFPDRIIIFLAPTKPLVKQQLEACSRVMGVSSRQIAEMTGSANVSNRRNLWQTRSIFFMTPQILDNDICRGDCPAEKVVLLVVDEAHRAIGRHAIVKSVEQLNHRVSAGLRILALTATPGSKLERIQNVISNLMISNLEIKNEEDEDIQQHVHNKESEVVAVGQDHRIMRACEELRDLLSPVIRRLQFKQLLHKHEVDNLNHGLLHVAQKRFISSPPGNFSREEVLSVQSDFNAAIFILRSCHNLERGSMKGPIQTLQNAKTECISKYGAKGDIVRKEGYSRVLNTLKNLREQECFLHPKLEKLKVILEQHFNRKLTQCSSSGDRVDSRAIVFASSRDCVEEICEEINRLQNVRASIFIGQQGTAFHKGQSQRIQQEVMNDFRNGRFNTMVATCIGEEGLDVGNVDIIIQYDLVNSPIRDVQRSGRTGRAREGIVVQLVMEGREALEQMQGEKKKSSLTKTLKTLNQCKKIDLYKHDSKLVDPLPPVIEIDFQKVVDEEHVPDKEARGKQESKTRAKKGKAGTPSTKEEKIAWMKEKGYHVDLSSFYGSQDVYSLQLDSWPEMQTVSSSVYRIKHNRRSKLFVSMMSKFFESQICNERSGVEECHGLECQSEAQVESCPEMFPANDTDGEEQGLGNVLVPAARLEPCISQDFAVACSEAQGSQSDMSVKKTSMDEEIEKYFPALESIASPHFYSGRDRIPLIPGECHVEMEEVARPDFAIRPEEKQIHVRCMPLTSTDVAVSATAYSEKTQRSPDRKSEPLVPNRTTCMQDWMGVRGGSQSGANQTARNSTLNGPVAHPVHIPSFDLGDSSGGEESESLQFEPDADLTAPARDAASHPSLEMEEETITERHIADTAACTSTNRNDREEPPIVISQDVVCNVSLDRSDISTPLVKVRKKRRRIVSSEEDESCDEFPAVHKTVGSGSSALTLEQTMQRPGHVQEKKQVETVSSDDEFETNPKFPKSKEGTESRKGVWRTEKGGGEKQKKGKGEKQKEREEKRLKRRKIRAKYFEDEAEQSEDHLTSSGNEQSAEEDKLAMNDSFINDEASESEASPGAMRSIYARSLMTQEEGEFLPRQHQGGYKMSFGKRGTSMLGRERSVSESESDDESDLSSFVVGSSQEVEEDASPSEDNEPSYDHDQGEPEDLCSPAARPARAQEENTKARFFVASSEFNSRLCQELRRPTLSDRVECVSTTRLQFVSYVCGFETAIIRKHLKDLKTDEQLSNLAQQVASARGTFDKLYFVLDTGGATAFALDPLKLDTKRYMEIISSISKANGVKLIVSDDPASCALLLLEIALEDKEAGTFSPSSATLEYIRGLCENPVLNILTQFPFLNLLHATFLFDRCPCLKDLCQLAKREEELPPLCRKRWSALKEWLWKAPDEILPGARDG